MNLAQIAFRTLERKPDVTIVSMLELLGTKAITKIHMRNNNESLPYKSFYYFKDWRDIQYSTNYFVFDYNSSIDKRPWSRFSYSRLIPICTIRISLNPVYSANLTNPRSMNKDVNLKIISITCNLVAVWWDIGAATEQVKLE